MKNIKHLLEPKKTAIFLAVFWTILITYMCLKTYSLQPQLFPNVDKVVHFTFYFVFVILWYRFLKIKNKNTKKNSFLLFLASIFFGIVIEYCQYFFTKSRMAEVLDVAANTLGSTIGIVTAIYFYKIKETA